MAPMGLTADADATPREGSAWRLVVGAGVAGLVLGAIFATGVVLGLTGNDNVEVGDTFTGEVYSYRAATELHPSVVCFSETDCGRAVMLDDSMTIDRGDQVTATKIVIWSDEGDGAWLYFVHPTTRPID